jgi:hypothetical protein
LLPCHMPTLPILLMIDSSQILSMFCHPLKRHCNRCNMASLLLTRFVFTVHVCLISETPHFVWLLISSGSYMQNLFKLWRLHFMYRMYLCLVWLTKTSLFLKRIQQLISVKRPIHSQSNWAILQCDSLPHEKTE